MTLWLLSVWLVSGAFACIASGGLTLHPSSVVPPNLVPPQIPVVVFAGVLHQSLSARLAHDVDHIGVPATAMRIVEDVEAVIANNQA